MNFYRLATEEDIDECAGHFFRNAPLEVLQLVENGQFHKAIARFRELRGYSVQECKKLCEEYQSFLQVKRDFRAGKPIYTDY